MRKPWLRMTCESVSWILVSTEPISVVLGQGSSFRMRPQIMWASCLLAMFPTPFSGSFPDSPMLPSSISTAVPHDRPKRRAGEISGAFLYDGLISLDIPNRTRTPR